MNFFETPYIGSTINFLVAGIFKKAQKVLEYLEANEEIRRYYELREKAIHVETTRLTGFGVIIKHSVNFVIK